VGKIFVVFFNSFKRRLTVLSSKGGVCHFNAKIGEVSVNIKIKGGVYDV
jgi:hypothetical protein